ncbi:hypothetical protein [Streptomyces sp. AC512_CC834]|uniref:hypothetical protein n=1 Tax=Streptomyces sp. AC512_CC834 TaxID=2823691 RepID=UPI001C2525EF|nr:hypothetical protein [Streptomyces sp. AC512_CC834]
MTRPTMRMCARCQRTTDEPILVHEVHAATGPGFNVYACPDCAPHYPPMTDPLDILDAAARRHSRLTLRVYKVDTDGTVTDAGRKVEVQAGGPNEPIPHSTAYPPCACPKCQHTG